MNYYFKSIGYEQYDPFRIPTIIAEVEIQPESNKELLNICEGINSTSLKGLEQLKSMFNSRPNLPNIKNVYFNPPATVVLWDNGTKTIVKCQDGDTYSRETGLALCMAKKAMGNSPRQFNDIFHKWIPEEKVDLSYRGDCASCKYCDLSEDEYPCHNCMLTNWEPAK